LTTRGFEGQDQSIFLVSRKKQKRVVILVNKWDLVEKTMSTRDYEENQAN
jgi:GTP-binding protein